VCMMAPSTSEDICRRSIESLEADAHRGLLTSVKAQINIRDLLLILFLYRFVELRRKHVRWG
jgi:hypothetical protein